MTLKIYTLWVSMRGEEPSPWMIAAEDEISWESDPDRCEEVFQKARSLADRNDWDYREITVKVDWNAVSKCFETGEIESEIEITAT